VFICVHLWLIQIFSAANHFDNGYISHAIPTPITMNSASDTTAYLILPLIDCRPRHAKDTETHSAKIIIAAKWLRWIPDPNIQDFRPQAIR
jgi:hypothetical protein